MRRGGKSKAIAAKRQAKRVYRPAENNRIGDVRLSNPLSRTKVCHTKGEPVAGIPEEQDGDVTNKSAEDSRRITEIEGDDP